MIALRAALGVALLLAACGSPEREKALVNLKARTPAERARAVRALSAKAKARDTETWVSLVRAARDPSAEVRLAAAESLATAPKAAELQPIEEGGPTDPDDSLGGLLADPRDEVRAAAAAALGKRCGPRAKGYLLGAFGRSGPAVRAVLGDSLGRCGSSLAAALTHWEAKRRARAHQLLDSQNTAQRAAGALELGLLGRDEDVKLLLPLLDETDGVLVAAAAKALGEAHAAVVEPRLKALLADEATTVSSSAAEGLSALGDQAVLRSRSELEAAAGRADDAAFSAAAALVSAGLPAADACRLAVRSRFARAAELLALAGSCAVKPLAEALAAQVGGARPAAAKASSRPTSPDAAQPDPAAAAILAALLVLPAAPAPQAGPALARLIQSDNPELAAQAARAAGLLQAKAAGPALVAVVRRERKLVLAERGAPPKPAGPEDDAAAAAVLAREAVRAPKADRGKYDLLMKKLAARGQAVDARTSARARLGAMLEGAPARRRTLLVAAIEAGLILNAPGMAAEVAPLRDDPEPDLARAARGEHEAAAAPPPDATECLPPRAKVAPPAGCLAHLPEALPPEVAGRARAAAQLAIFHDDGAERAAACALLRRLDGPAAAAMLAPFGSDPERRVRNACAPAPPENKTAPPVPR